MCDKAKIKASQNLKNQIKKMAKTNNQREEWKHITKYNSMIIGIHNYYRMAAHINLGMSKIAHSVNAVAKNRLRKRLKKIESLDKYKYIKDRYGSSQQIRFVNKIPLCPVAYVKTKPPKNQANAVNKYTTEGRKIIHKSLKLNMKILHALMKKKETYGCIEFLDNRISLYAAQNGRCAVTGENLSIDEIHCHHKIPKEQGGTDNYRNLVIFHKDVHKLVHAKSETAIRKYFQLIQPDKKKLAKINKFRKMAFRGQIEN